MKYASAKKASITLPRDLEKNLKSQAKKEGQTLSGLLQEAAKQYLNLREYEAIQKDLARRARELGLKDDNDVDDLVHSLRYRQK